MISGIIFTLINPLAMAAIFMAPGLQEGPAETFNYMVAGFVVIFGAMGLYLVSLVTRNKNLSQDLETLQKIEERAG